MNDIERAITTVKCLSLKSNIDTKGLMDDLDLAIQALQEKAERENPKPLTLEQLKEREGKPVWCKGKTIWGTNFEGWKVLSRNNLRYDVIRFTDGTERLSKDYGEKFIVYDHEPKEVETR